MLLNGIRRICNVSENDLSTPEEELKYVNLVKEFAKQENSKVLVVCAKIEQELSELEEAIENGCPMSISEEFGDLLFAVVNVSRFIKVDAEETLKIFSIGKCANLQRKSAGGYKWKYKEAS